MKGYTKFTESYIELIDNDTDIEIIESDIDRLKRQIHYMLNYHENALRLANSFKDVSCALGGDASVHKAKIEVLKELLLFSNRDWYEYLCEKRGCGRMS